MKRIDKRSVLTVVLALMLVLSTGFYTVLRPTTAWFHSADSVEKAYMIGSFNVDYNAYVHQNATLTFDATTRIEEALANDAARNKEFEYAVQYLYLNVRNDMEPDRVDPNYLDALVKIKLDDTAVANGLRYYYFACSSPAAIPESTSYTYYGEAVTDTNGSFTNNGNLSSKIKTFCGQTIASDTDYRDPAKNTLINFNSSDGFIRVPHNQQVTICIALWVDHGTTGRTNLTYTTQISLYAQQATTA